MRDLDSLEIDSADQRALDENNTRTGQAPARVSHSRLRTPPKEKFIHENLGRGFVTVGGFIIIALTLAIIVFLFVRGLGTFTKFGHSLGEFLFSSEWAPSNSMDEGGGQVGAAVYIVGSLLTCGLTILIVTPIAMAAAILIVEILPRVGENIIRPMIEIFVGIPSIVYGWFGLSVIVPFIRDHMNAPVGGYSVLAAVIVLSTMIFPTVTTMMCDSLNSVPNSYRSGAYALGATRWQMIHTVAIPTCRAGLWTAIVIGLARAFGEALAVAMVIGRTPLFAKGLLYPTSNITGVIASEMGETINGSEFNTALWSLALLLLLISIAFIVIIHTLSDRQERLLKGIAKTNKEKGDDE